MHGFCRAWHWPGVQPGRVCMSPCSFMTGTATFETRQRLRVYDRCAAVVFVCALFGAVVTHAVTPRDVVVVSSTASSTTALCCSACHYMQCQHMFCVGHCTLVPVAAVLQVLDQHNPWHVSAFHVDLPSVFLLRPGPFAGPVYTREPGSATQAGRCICC